MENICSNFGLSNVMDRLDVINQIVLFDTESLTDQEIINLESELDFLSDKLRQYKKIARFNEVGLRLISN